MDLSSADPLVRLVIGVAFLLAFVVVGASLWEWMERRR